MYSYPKDNEDVEKKTNSVKNCVVNCELKFENQKTSAENNKTSMRTQQRFDIKAHNAFTEKVSEIALSASADNRTQSE